MITQETIVCYSKQGLFDMAVLELTKGGSLSSIVKIDTLHIYYTYFFLGLLIAWEESPKISSLKSFAAFYNLKIS